MATDTTFAAAVSEAAALGATTVGTLAGRRPLEGFAAQMARRPVSRCYLRAPACTADDRLAEIVIRLGLAAPDDADWTAVYPVYRGET